VAAPGQIACDAGTVDAAADHEHIDGLGRQGRIGGGRAVGHTNGNGRVQAVSWWGSRTESIGRAGTFTRAKASSLEFRKVRLGSFSFL
jgi:hypothetical protein